MMDLIVDKTCGTCDHLRHAMDRQGNILGHCCHQHPASHRMKNGIRPTEIDSRGCLAWELMKEPESSGTDTLTVEGKEMEEK